MATWRRPIELFVVFCLLLASLVFVHPAQAAKIDDLQVTATLGLDGKLQVEEIIKYNFEDAKVASVNLLIPIKYQYQDQNFFLDIGDINVTDAKDKSLSFNSSKQSSVLNLEVSDQDRFFSGLTTFKLKYTATGVISYSLDQDLFYWNLTSNNWPLKIKHSQVKITLPKKVVVDSDQLNCFYGPAGKELKCRASMIDQQIDQASFVFENPFELFAGESNSVTFNLPKGVIAEPTWPEVLKSFFLRNLEIILPSIIVLAILLIWRRASRPAPEF